MADFILVLNENERQELVRILTQGIGDTRVEVHRTHSPDFREQVIAEESLLRGLLNKLNARPQPAKSGKL